MCLLSLARYSITLMNLWKSICRLTFPVGWKMRSAECGKCGVWKMRSMENTECGKRGVWKMRSMENTEYGK